MAITTQFRQSVYLAVHSVAAGQVAGYGQIAAIAGYPGYARHVGKLMSQLPNDTELPWHRILRSDGKIAFDAQSTAAARQSQRLIDEGVAVTNNRVPKRYFIDPITS